VSQLEQAQAAQEAFSRQLIASQEAERKRIAAEMHDSLGQRLVVIKHLAYRGD
jgi:signal transduction histidine kinase